MKLSILMPVYNEAETVQNAIKRLLDVEFPCPVEFVVVDDGSTDGTSEILEGLHDDRLIKLQHAVNQGKGAAVRTAAAAATGDYVQPFDADMEYQPEEIPELLKPVLRGEATVVFGSRTFGSHSAYSFWYVMGNKGVTTVANILFNAYIADLETCYKLMPLELYRSLDITSNGFGMEAEITGKLLARQIRPFEVPITYRARSREEGKKITWKDGVAAVWLLTRIRVTSKRPAPRRRGLSTQTGGAGQQARPAPGPVPGGEVGVSLVRWAARPRQAARPRPAAPGPGPRRRPRGHLAGPRLLPARRGGADLAPVGRPGRARPGRPGPRRVPRHRPVRLVPPLRGHGDSPRAAAGPGDHGAERAAGRQPDVEHVVPAARRGVRAR